MGLKCEPHTVSSYSRITYCSDQPEQGNTLPQTELRSWTIPTRGTGTKCGGWTLMRLRFSIVTGASTNCHDGKLKKSGAPNLTCGGSYPDSNCGESERKSGVLSFVSRLRLAPGALESGARNPRETRRNWKHSSSRSNGCSKLGKSLHRCALSRPDGLRVVWTNHGRPPVVPRVCPVSCLGCRFGKCAQLESGDGFNRPHTRDRTSADDLRLLGPRAGKISEYSVDCRPWMLHGPK
jgi:hypothetical protein